MAETPWNTSPDFAVARQISGKPVPVPGHYWWGPRGGTEPSPAFEILPGQQAAIIWDADTTGSGGSETLQIQLASGAGDGANEWIDYDSTPLAANKILILAIPGIYRFVPSAQAANGRMKLSLFPIAA